MPKLVLLMSIALALFVGVAAAPPHRTSGGRLDVYFIDTEGGAATLIVTPMGESILIDSGNPGDRDAGRIAHAAKDVAGLKQIDHYVTTHWHPDHMGGVQALSRMMPIIHFYDHGIANPPLSETNLDLLNAYKAVSQGKSVTLKPGDQISLRNSSSGPKLVLKIVASNGIVSGESPGAPQIRSCGKDDQAQPLDASDNANSLALVLSYSRFVFFDGGDLTWNVENKLVCPTRLVSQVDVYQVDHHGLGSSNNPSLVRALNPHIAIIGNGPHKGDAASTVNTLKALSSVTIYQLHANLDDPTLNAPAKFVANDGDADRGDYVKLSVDPSGNSYSVSIPGKGTSSIYKTINKP